MTDRNPLTGLPGNQSISRVLEEQVVSGNQTAVYVDIINFKPFNDHYGFALGDAVIRRLGMILVESLPEHFVGHIGGDDFICAGSGDSFAEGVEEARQRFRSIVPGFYSQRDREQGGIETFDRRGSYRFFPMLDVSLVFTGPDDNYGSVEKLAAAAGKTKKRMKGELIIEPVYPVLEKALGANLPSPDLKALIEACGVLREEDAVSVLGRILQGTFHWNLRKSAALALGHIGNAVCTDMLLEALKDSNPHVRTRSVEGLVLSMGSESGPVIRYLAEDRSTWVRRAVLRGIGRSGWLQGLDILEAAAVSRASGRILNTTEERRAALEGLSMMGLRSEAPLLHRLCGTRDYRPAKAAFRALCTVGTDLAADMILSLKCDLPPVLNLFSMERSNLEALEQVAVNSLEAGDMQAGFAVRFFEGYPGTMGEGSIARLKNSLGNFYGDLFRRVVVLLEARSITADRSCVARVANRLDRGERVGDDALCAFLGWVSRKGGVNPGALLKSFIRTDRRPVAAAAAVAAGALANYVSGDNKLG